MKLAACVILYNPPNTLLGNIKSYLSYVDVLLVFDNSSESFSKKTISSLQNTRYYWDGENKGISIRLNQAIEICKNLKFDFLLTMDQDSFFPKQHFKYYLEKIESIKDIHKIGMFGLNTNDNSKKIEENTLLITSGSIVNVSIANEIGMFDENLFIDEVDHEFCLRILLNNYKTLKIGGINFSHQFGLNKIVLTPIFKYEQRSIYSPLRIYYLTRNYFYINSIYKNKINFKEIRYKGLVNKIKNSLLYENKFKILYYIMKAYIDFKNKKMGKINH